jgi:signal transduction histidine kinase
MATDGRDRAAGPPAPRTHVPWFGPEDARAVADFFAVYEIHVDVRAMLATAAAVDPGVAGAIRAMQASITPEVAVEKRALLRRAIAGDWEPYERDLATEGALFATHGARDWQAITRVVAHDLTPRLVAAYADDPPRLAAALLAMQRFLDNIRATVGEGFLAQREQMLREVEALRAENAELEAFGAAAAHDLRAPLRAIAGFARVLDEDFGAALGPEGAAHVGRIVANTERMSALIDALLALGRVSRAALHPQRTDLSSLARDVVADLRAAEPSRVVDVVVEDGLAAVADPTLARTLLANLVGNAWKFTARAAAARVEVGREGAAFFVRDNGAGFEMARAARLFSAFERLHRAAEFPGTGLGLATSQRIVHRHGGRLWAHARPGEGATFFFELAPA